MHSQYNGLLTSRLSSVAVGTVGTHIHTHACTQGI